jgi:hypothetical protein
MTSAQESADKVAEQLAQVAEAIAPDVVNLEAQVAAGERPDLGELMVAAESLGELVDTVEELPGEVLMEDCGMGDGSGDSADMPSSMPMS